MVQFHLWTRWLSERIHTGHHSLQKIYTQWPIPPFLITSLTTWREELCRVYTTDLLPYANSSKTTQMKMIIWDATYGMVSFPLDLLIWIKEKYSSEEWGKPFGFISTQCVTDISEKYERIANRYYIKPICKVSHTLNNSLMRTRLIRAQQEMVKCVCSTPCECGRSYIGETSRPSAARLKEQRWNLGHLEKFYISSTCLCRGSSCTPESSRDLTEWNKLCI